MIVQTLVNHGRPGCRLVDMSAGTSKLILLKDFAIFCPSALEKQTEFPSLTDHSVNNQSYGATSCMLSAARQHPFTLTSVKTAKSTF